MCSPRQIIRRDEGLLYTPTAYMIILTLYDVFNKFLIFQNKHFARAVLKINLPITFILVAVFFSVRFCTTTVAHPFSFDSDLHNDDISGV